MRKAYADMTLLTCPNCGGHNMECLVRRCVSFDVRGLLNGKLVIGPRQREVIEEELDEDLKCLDCGGDSDVANFGVAENDPPYGPDERYIYAKRLPRS